MGNVRLAALAVLLGALGGCASSLQIQSEHDPRFDFSSVRTYDWLAIDQPEFDSNTAPEFRDPRFEAEALDPPIRAAVDRELAARGYQRVTESADFLVAYHAALNTAADATRLGDYVTWEMAVEGTLPGLSTASDYMRIYEQGSVILDFVSPDAKQLLWRGSVQAEIDRSNTQAQRVARINDVIGELLQRFPPR